MRSTNWFIAAALLAWVGCGDDDSTPTTPEDSTPPIAAPFQWNDIVTNNLSAQFTKGQAIFRDDTFGSEAYWGGQLQLHLAILGEAQGGVGPGLSPRAALDLGLRVNLDRLPADVVDGLEAGVVDLDSPATTVALLRANAIIGLRGVFDGGTLTSIGITCALCHSTVDDALTAGVGRPRDGWPNRALNVGKIVSLAPNLSPLEDLLGASRAQVVAVLESWGPGKFDAELNLDGKAFQPNGRSGATVIPAAFGLAGQNLHTYTGFGSIPYWNAYVANTQMHGLGTFVDRRLTPAQFPLIPKTGFNNKRDPVDLITSKLEALHVYQIAIPAPTPAANSFDAAAATRGQQLFAGKAKCATCHVQPLYSEPGFAMHTGAEIGIDDFQANRSPEHMYRTTPLRGLFTRLTPGLYHDGRFPTLDAVVDHYNATFALGLTDAEQADLVQYLLSL